MFRILLALLLLLCSQTVQAITVSITTPSDGQSYTAPATFSVASIAEPVEDGEQVRSHKIYRNGAEIASGTIRNLSVTVSNLPADDYWFHSVATNNLNQTVSSTPILVTVVVPGGLPPTVTLGTPTGAPFIAPATVGLSAAASDSDGTITRVDFYAGSTLLGSDPSSPYQFSWTNVAAGSYSVTAKATDSNNISTTSAPRTVTITTSLVKGAIDGVSLNGSVYEVRGWACSTGRNPPINVHLYAGASAGNPGAVNLGAFAANLPSGTEIAAACQASGTAYRFAIALSDAVREQHANKKLYVHGISPVGSGNALLTGSGVHVVPAPRSQTRSYSYNAHQELCRSVEPETGATLYGYDGAGNLAWSAAGLAGTPACATGVTAPAAVESRTVYRAFDARNRLEALSFPDGNGDQDWSYWPDGLAKIVKTWNIGTDGAEAKETQNNYIYNRRRLLTTESIVDPAWYGFNVGYDYNANGHMTTTHYPSGQAVHTTVNALGQPTALASAATGGTAYASGITYYPNGAVAGFTYGNDIVHTMTQNDRQLPALSRDAYGATEFLEDAYSYDGNGNVTRIDDTLTANRSDRIMTYDALDRLTDVTSPMYGSTGAHYTYNGLDDLTRVQLGGTAARDHHYCYDARHQLSNIKTTSCSGTTVTGLGYDAQGNLANKDGQLYQFDTGNRLREVVGVERYRYDAHGRRVLAMQFATGTVLSHYAMDGRLMYQKSDRTGLQSDSIYLGGSLVAIREIPIEQ